MTTTYTKKINRFFTGMVVAEVRRQDDSAAGLEHFQPLLWESDEHLMKRAHKWADDLIDILKKYEV